MVGGLVDMSAVKKVAQKVQVAVVVLVVMMDAHLIGGLVHWMVANLERNLGAILVAGMEQNLEIEKARKMALQLVDKMDF